MYADMFFELHNQGQSTLVIVDGSRPAIDVQDAVTQSLNFLNLLPQPYSVDQFLNTGMESSAHTLCYLLNTGFTNF